MAAGRVSFRLGSGSWYIAHVCAPVNVPAPIHIWEAVIGLTGEEEEKEEKEEVERDQRPVCLPMSWIAIGYVRWFTILYLRVRHNLWAFWAEIDGKELHIGQAPMPN